MRFNRARELRDGDDVLLLSSGVHTELTIQAADDLERAGVSVGHLHVSTLKPFTDEVVLERLARARRVVTVENHLVRGGLGTAVAETISENGFGATLRRIGVRDTFTHGGTRDYLFGYYGLDRGAILRTVEALLGRSLDLDAGVADATRGQQHNSDVAEGL